MQHAASHTTTIQPSSHNQRHILIGKQWYQLPELIPTNSNSGLHHCISISIHTQHVTQVTWQKLTNIPVMYLTTEITWDEFFQIKNNAMSKFYTGDKVKHDCRKRMTRMSTVVHSRLVQWCRRDQQLGAVYWPGRPLLRSDRRNSC